MLSFFERPSPIDIPLQRAAAILRKEFTAEQLGVVPVDIVDVIHHRSSYSMRFALPRRRSRPQLVQITLDYVYCPRQLESGQLYR